MINLNSFQGPQPRCVVTNTKLPNFLDQEQPPRKKRPFSTVLSLPFSHSLDILLPEAAAKSLHTRLTENGFGTLQYSKVYMKLLDIISGDFFNTYIKSPSSSDTLLLSEGRPGIDHVFSLSQGILRLEVDKATFEQLGLQGKPISGEGRKHVKARYAIELNLHLPNMVRGKPAFMRTVWAFENVLNNTVTWLLCSSKGSSVEVAEALAQHHPIVRTVEPRATSLGETMVPAFPDISHEDDYAEAAETLEWLTLAMLESPRVRQDDAVDAYLSRYQVPGSVTAQNLVSFKWTGLIPPEFAHKIFLAAIRASGTEWTAVTSSAFDGETCTILVHDGHALTWEYRD